MKLVFSTPYIYIYHIEESNIMYSEWTEQASDMSKEEFKKHVLQIVEEGDRFGVKGYITNSRKGHFIMSSEVQKWHEEVVVPVLLGQNFRKLAFILPQKDDDFAAAVSLELTFSEEKASEINTKFFKSVDEAIEWVKK